MNAHDEDRTKQLLKRGCCRRLKAMPEPERDLWPAMLRRLDAKRGAPSLLHRGRGSIGRCWPGLLASPPSFRRRSPCFFTTCEPAGLSPAEKEDFMNTHPYLRAYLAGTFVPTLILPLLLTVFIVVRIVLKVPVPIEQAHDLSHGCGAIALGPMEYALSGSHARTHLPIGLHGAMLPMLC